MPSRHIQLSAGLLLLGSLMRWLPSALQFLGRFTQLRPLTEQRKPLDAGPIRAIGEWRRPQPSWEWDEASQTVAASPLERRLGVGCREKKR
jgi:hypothetical protein